MIKELIISTKKHLPLIIKGVIYDEDNLCIYGDNWSFNSTSAFRITTPNSFLGNTDKEINSNLELIVEKKIIGIIPFGNNRQYDFSFELEHNKIIDIFSNSYFEPWIFKIEGEITYVPTY